MIQDYLIEDLATFLETSNIGTVNTDIFIGELPLDVSDCISILDSPSPDPSMTFDVFDQVFEIWSRHKSANAGYAKLKEVADLLDRTHHYAIGRYYVYLARVIGRIDDNDRDVERRKLYKLTVTLKCRLLLPEEEAPHAYFWNADIDYSVGAVVVYNGLSYVAILGGINHLPTTSPTYWQLITIAGEQGETGPGVAAGGTDGQVLLKVGTTDFATEWADLTKDLVGLGNVDNTSDADKPVSDDTQDALDLKLNVGSTTADIDDSVDRRYVTDDDLTLLGNTSGVNTGDQDLSSYLTSAGAALTYLKLDASNDPITGDLKLTPTANSLTNFQVLRQDGVTPILNVDTINSRVGIGTATPSASLHVYRNDVDFDNGNAILMEVTGDHHVGYSLANNGKQWQISMRKTFENNSLRFFHNDGTNWLAPALVMNVDGTIGIGTASPLTKLTVLETGSASPRGILSMQISADTNGARLGFSKARGTTSVPAIVTSGDVIGKMVFRGYDGANYLEMGAIEVGSSGTIALTRVPTYMAFSTATNAAPSVLTERMRIDNAGNIGIGTSTPATNLDLFVPSVVTGGTPASANINIFASDFTSNNFNKGGSINFSGYYNSGNIANTNAYGFIAGRKENVTDNNSRGYLVLGSMGTEVMRISSSGEVGIGGAGPTSGRYSFSLAFLGAVARSIGMERHTTSNTAGNSLTIQAGGATLLATDKGGGSLILASGISTGSSRSGILFQVATQGSAGTGDNAVATNFSMFSTSSTNGLFVIGAATGLGLSSTGSPISTNAVLLNGNVSGGFAAYRHTTANTAGNVMVIQSAGATSLATDKAGGALSLRAGISTGSGNSQVQFFTASPAATGAVATVAIQAGGTGYTTGDILTITGGTGDCTLQVTAVAGVVTAVAIVAAGTTYGPSNNYPTTVAPAGGTGCLINILTITGTADNAPTSKMTLTGEGLFALTPTFRNISGTVTPINFSPVYSTPVSSAAGYRTFNIAGVVGVDGSAVETYTNGIQSIHQELEVRTSGLITSIVGIECNGLMTRLNGAATAAATNVTPLVVNGYSRPSGGATTATITNLTGIDINTVTTTQLTATTVKGISVRNLAAGTFTTMVGIDVAGQTQAATNIGIRIGLASGGATANYALQLSDTTGVAGGGITFGVDVQLYRSAANLLRSDDDLDINGNINLSKSNTGIFFNAAGTFNYGVLKPTAGTTLEIRAGSSSAILTLANTSITIKEASDIILGTTTGSKLGTAAAQKLGFWGAAPIVQPAAGNQAALTNSTGGVYDGTLVDVTTTGLADPAKVNANFTDVYTLLTEIRLALVNTGLIKGAA